MIGFFSGGMPNSTMSSSMPLPHKNGLFYTKYTLCYVKNTKELGTQIHKVCTSTFFVCFTYMKV